MSEHLIINDTFGKSQKVLEKMTGQTIDELESEHAAQTSEF